MNLDFTPMLRALSEALFPNRLEAELRELKGTTLSLRLPRPFQREEKDMFAIFPQHVPALRRLINLLKNEGSQAAARILAEAAYDLFIAELSERAIWKDTSSFMLLSTDEPGSALVVAELFKIGGVQLFVPNGSSHIVILSVTKDPSAEIFERLSREGATSILSILLVA